MYEKDLKRIIEASQNGKILCVSFSWDDYLKVEPLIDAAYSGELI